jgi:four helix bundle protein
VRCALSGEEKYNLASQLRRAATSVPLNIAEGCGTSSNAEFARYLGYAYRSLKEVVTCLELCQRLYPPSRTRAHILIVQGNEIFRMTYSLIRKIHPKINSR